MNTPLSQPISQQLRASARRAVAQSAADLEQLFQDSRVLEEKLSMSLAAIEQAAEQARGSAHGEPLQQAAEQARARLAGALTDLQEHITLRRETRASFVVAMFGRTHIGKSTLAEALSCGDGGTVSTGQTGFTDIRGQLTPPLTFLDCPGFAPLGANHQRHTDEARRAVLQSDVVLLCFDTTNQKSDEFKQIALWVARYQKPVVAVLNVRNGRWNSCHPGHKMTDKAHRTINSSVAGHVRYIKGCLGGLGLRAPIVVLSAQRALFARSVNYKGPEATARKAWLDHVGRQQTAQSSNITALEALLVELIGTHGGALRQAALRGDLRGAAQHVADTLQPVCRHQERILGKLTQQLAELVQWIGHPATRPLYANLKVLGARRRGYLLEQLRMLGLREPKAPSTLSVIASSLARKHPLGAVQEARDRLPETVDMVVSRQAQTRDAILNSLRLRKTLPRARKRLLDALQQEVRSHVSTQLDRLAIDLDAIHEDSIEHGFDDLTLQTGQAAYYLGWAARIGTVIAGLFLNVAGILAAIGFSILGGLFRRSRRRKEARARQKAMAALHGALDRLVEQELAWVDQIRDKVQLNLWESFLLELTDQTYRRQAVLVTLQDVQLTCAKLGRSGPVAVTAGSDAVATASGAVLKRHGTTATRFFEAPRPPSGGESSSPRTHPLPLPLPTQPAAPHPTSESARGALKQLRQRAQQRGLLAPISAAVHRSLERLSRPTPICLAGEYSSGKTSLVRRLSVDFGLGAPTGLSVVGSAPTTDAVASIPWSGDAALLDVPGFQGHDARHDKLALDAARRAAALVVVVPPVLSSGDAQAVRELLSGRAPLPPQPTLVVIGRADELGADPQLAGADFARRRADKIAEATEKLGLEGVGVHVVAADPFGLQADTAAPLPGHFDPYRGWDGIAELSQAIADTAGQLRHSGPACAALRCAAHDLLDLRDAEHDRARRLTDRAHLAERVASIYQSTARRMGELHDEAGARLLTTLQAYMRPHLSAIAGAADPTSLKAAVEGAEDWAAPAEGGLQEAWAAIVSDAEAIHQDCATQMQEAFTSPLGQRVIRLDGSAGGPKRPDIRERVVDGPLNRMLRDLVRSGGKALQKDPKLIRDMVIRFGHKVGYKFRPWEATRYAKHLGRVGQFLKKANPILVVVGELVDIVMEKRHAKRFQEARAQASAALEEQARALIEELLDSRADNQTLSLRQQLAASRDRFVALADEASQEHDALRTEAEYAGAIAEFCRQEVAPLAAMLNHPGVR